MVEDYQSSIAKNLLDNFGISHDDFKIKSLIYYTEDGSKICAP
jgi:hypothetical protein